MIKNKISDYVSKALYEDKALTKFLDFEEQKEIFAAKVNGLNVYLFGGNSDCERKRAIISYNEPKEEGFKIAILESKIDQKFKQITHRHVLGTIMSLGIERNTFGDILVDNDRIIIFVSEEIKEYIIDNFKTVLRYPLEWFERNNSDVVLTKEEIKIINIASMRLDAILSRSINCGRNDAQEMIKRGDVLINHQECTSISHIVKENDILSVHHYGRINIYEQMGITKKERICLKIGIKH